ATRWICYVFAARALLPGSEAHFPYAYTFIQPAEPPVFLAKTGAQPGSMPLGRPPGSKSSHETPSRYIRATYSRNGAGPAMVSRRAFVFQGSGFRVQHQPPPSLLPLIPCPPPPYHRNSTPPVKP